MESAKRKKTKHHYLPRSYLEFFSENGKIATVDRATGDARVGDPANTAAQKDFYSFVDTDGNERDDLEHEFSRLEGEAHKVIANINSRLCLQPTFTQRDALAAFVALQALRTPEQRRQHELMTDFSAKIHFRMEVRDEASARKALEDRGLPVTEESVLETLEIVRNIDDFEFVPHQNESIRQTLDLWPMVAKFMSGRRWTTVVFDEPMLITSDHPVLLTPHPDQPKFLGTGFKTAHEILFPLTPTRLLVMGSPNQFARAESCDIVKGSAKVALAVNQQLMRSSYLQYFMSPSLVNRNRIGPLGHRALQHISGGPFSDLAKQTNKVPHRKMPDRFVGAMARTHAPHPHPAPPKAP